VPRIPEIGSNRPVALEWTAKIRPDYRARMDSNLLSAFIGILGGLAGVGIGAYLQRRVTHAQMCRETTLHLYDRLDDSDILDSRIKADGILSANAALPQPKSLAQLYATLPRDEWQHISRTRHFIDQIGLLRRIGYLDDKIAVPLFASFVEYWVDRHFGPLEELDRTLVEQPSSRPQQWRVPSTELKKLFMKRS
jgi:hypothetical protein